MSARSRRECPVTRVEVAIEAWPSPRRQIESIAEDVQDVLDAGLAIGGETPQVCAPDHDRSGSERERLGDVAAAPDPAVEKHLDLVADHVDDRGQQPDGSGSRIEVVPP